MYLVLAAFGCARPVDAPAAAEARGAWLEAHRVPVATTDPGAPLDDLARLGPILGGRRVVALGEATHGTAEFFQVRHRLVRLLAEQHGYELVALEIPYETGVRLDAWIHGGPGDVHELLRGTYFWLDAAEIAALVTWMRERAKAHPIELFGFDVQGERGSARALAGHAAVDGDVAALLTDIADGRLATVADLERAAAALAELRQDLTRDVRALGHAAVVAQAVDLMRFCRRGADAGCLAAGRDAYMAENVARRLGETGGSAVVWAHNGHVAHVAHADGWQSMGYALREALGDPEALYSVAFEFDRGRFTAPAGGVGATGWTRTLPELGGFEVAEYTLGPAPPELLAHTLAAVSPTPWFLDLGAVEGLPEAEGVLGGRVRLHEYGAFAPSAPRHSVEVDLHEGWDGLVFVPETTAARPGP